uniref:Uncharacterized protein n=1 Tax=Anguilla anguilla TaxID=7936 RepID=A0A0E9XQA7_ANGAN
MLQKMVNNQKCSNKFHNLYIKRRDTDLFLFLLLIFSSASTLQCPMMLAVALVAFSLLHHNNNINDELMCS